MQCLIDDNSLDIEFANLNTDVQVQEWHDISRYEQEEEHTYYVFPADKKEFYEVFPYEGSPGNGLKYLYKSLKLLLQQYKEACLQCMVHLFLLESKDLFTYMMPMHRKQVRLQKDYALRCSKPQLEVRLVNHRIDIPWDPCGRIWSIEA